jgi:hypothetical protein
MVEFDRVVFKTGKGTEAPVEGKRFDMKDQIRAAVVPCPLAIIRSHHQAIAPIGGTVQFDDQRDTVLKASRGGREIRAQIAGDDSEDGRASNRRVELVKQ